MEQAQDYSFNKSHAACYAMIAYRTAYLRANWPAEYMAALISSVMNTKDKVPFYVAACDEMGIEVLPPDVNVSAEDFRVVEEKIRVRLERRKERGRDRRPRDSRGTRGRRSVPFHLGLLRARRPAGRQQARFGEPCEVRAFDSTDSPRKGMHDALEIALGHGTAHDDLGPGVDLRRRPGGVASAADRGRGVGEGRASCL